ncbi:MAG: rod shape-determining protein MreB, partial [Abditibacteriota bacterium]|nr:rod shape-determining protein MreB [Abditibacteriota bacterium]
MLGISRDIGIDLGTANVLIYQRGRGIVLREPSVVAVHKHTKELRAAGEEARQMLGRTPTSIVAMQPIRDGVIADYTVTEQMLRHFIEKVCGKRFLFKPRVIICVPSGVTSVERRAVLDAARSAGAKEAYPIEEPMAAAIGAGLPISDPEGNMVVDIGGGTSDVAVISLGGIVKSESVRIGGNKLDEAIHRYIKREYNLIIGDRTAEEIKIGIGSAYPLDEELTMEVKGRDMVNGLPKTAIITSSEIRDAISEVVHQIVLRTRSVLEQTPPELAADIVSHGIWLTGGGAMLRGMDKLLAHETGIPVQVADDPLSCVAICAGQALDHIELLSETHF